MQPALTPLQALNKLLEGKHFVIKDEAGFSYQLEGSQGCPEEGLYPIAYVTELDEQIYAPDHDEDEPVTESTSWVLC